MVAGSSMGGIVGGLFATGTDLYFLEKYAEKFAIKKYLDFSLRDGGLVRGKKTEQLIRLLTKNIGIEQTRIPFACVAVDLGSFIKIRRSIRPFERRSPSPAFLRPMRWAGGIILTEEFWSVFPFRRSKCWARIL